MRHVIHAGLAALTLFGAAGCDSGTSNTPDGGEAPDSGLIADRCTAEAPCALTAGTMASEYISPSMDEDPWTIDVPAAGSILQVLVTNDADFSPIRLEVALFGPAGAALETRSFTGNGKQRIDLQLVTPAAGAYKIVVRDAGNDAADRRNPYYILASILTQTDSNEPNDTPAQAVMLAPDQPKTGTIGAQGDVDWYAIDVPANDLIQISLATTAKGTSPVTFKYELYAPDGNTRIAESIEETASAATLRENRAVGNQPGRYLIKVLDEPSNGDQADLMRTYILTVGLVAEPDANDLAAPNDSSNVATAASSGQTLTGYIAAKSDADYYVVRVTDASAERPALITVEATLDPSSSVDLAFTVLDQNGRDLVCADDEVCKAFRFVPDNGAPERPTKLATSHAVRAPGRYFVVVRDNQDNDYDTAHPYTVKIDVVADPDTNEQWEHGPDGARTIRAATSTAGLTIQYPWVEGYISYADDEDWFAFDVPGPMGAAPGQNGDWLVQIDIQKSGPTPVELQVFFAASDLDYGRLGAECRMPAPNDPDITGLSCQQPDADNAIDRSVGEVSGDCLVTFREHSAVGPHYIRVTDLNRDDFDVRPSLGAYRFRLTFTAKCSPTSHCAGMFTDQNGGDLCRRP